jgi:hypothetical protein
VGKKGKKCWMIPAFPATNAENAAIMADDIPSHRFHQCHLAAINVSRIAPVSQLSSSSRARSLTFRIGTVASLLGAARTSPSALKLMGALVVTSETSITNTPRQKETR